MKYFEFVRTFVTYTITQLESKMLSGELTSVNGCHIEPNGSWWAVA